MSSIEKAILLTSSFEGHIDGYVNVTGNFDGQGISLEILIKKRTILKKIFNYTTFLIICILVFSVGVGFKHYKLNNMKEDNNIWINLNHIQNSILNTDYSHDKRVELTLQYIDELLAVLENEMSYELSDESLEKKLNYSVKSITKEISNAKLRIIRYDGVQGLFGTSEGKWTIIQWKNKEVVHSQILFFDDPDVVVDFIGEANDNLEILLGGYVTLYKPFPIFLSSWTLRGEKWEENDYFNDMEFNENYTVNANFLMIEDNKNTHLEVNNKNNGFIISNIDDNKYLFEIVLADGEITLIK